MTSIIIVSFNRLDLIKKCLAAATKAPDSEIILVDNNSTDDVVGFVKTHYPKVRVIVNKKNTGFAIGNNQGMRAGKGDYLLALNTDAFLEKDAVAKLTKFAKSHPDTGVVGPKLLNPDGTLQPSAGSFPSLWTVLLIMITIDNWPFFRKFLPSIHNRYPGHFKTTRTFDWVTGACLLIPRGVFEKTKGFDENYFMYGEEQELQYRMHELGYKSYYLPSAQAIHLGFSSSSPANGAIKELLSYIAFFKKYKPSWQIPILKTLIVSGCLLRICRGLVQTKHRWMISAYMTAIIKILYES